jgi:hypothetical protein
MELDDEQEAMGKLLGEPGELVPEVDFADIKAMWDFMQDTKKRRPEWEGRFAIGAGVYQSVCSPGADIRAVSYRLSILGMVGHLLEPVYSGGQFTEAALKAAAKVEMNWLPVGVPQKGFPFDVIEFLARARAEAEVA